MIFDEYTARLRAQLADMPEDPKADEILVHDVDRIRADRAIADVDHLSSLLDFAAVVQEAGVRVSIEIHRMPSSEAR